MEEKMKNLFEYLKEIYELKTRVALDSRLDTLFLAMSVSWKEELFNM